MAVKKELSYQEAVAEIEEILQKIEQDELDVDQLALNVKRVSQLIRSCREKLHKTEIEVEKILNDIDEEES